MVEVIKKKSNVLVIEDDKFLRELIIQKLRKEGFETHSAIEVSEALKAIEQEKPNLILLDLVLPGMDGFAAIDFFKKTRQTSEIPIIVLSNLGQKEGIEKAIKSGAAAYLVKSENTPSEIVDRIRNVLRQKYI